MDVRNIFGIYLDRSFHVLQIKFITTVNLQWAHKTSGSDCSLRQGAGGTEFKRFRSRTCFLR